MLWIQCLSWLADVMWINFISDSLFQEYHI
jgi:hypothetical protein